MEKDIEQIAADDGRFSPKALRFVYEGLGYTMKNHSAGAPHVSGQALCEGLKNLSIEKWGRLALMVLASWGVRTTRDFGEIVYLMIKNRWMSAQPTDSIEDFDDAYDFKTVFGDQFTF